MTDFPDYAQTNREHWNRHADWWVNPGRRSWASPDPAWGIWGLDNRTIPLLPDDMSGQQTIELGCGTGYVSSWMIRRGARATGIDPSDRQLESARAFMAEFGMRFELIHGVAESVPRPDESFDFAISEYGAAIWADPFVWIPEAWRLLRPGGRLHFLGHSTLAMVCTPLYERDSDVSVQRQLQHDYFGLHRCDWTEPADPSVEFNLPISAWFDLFKKTGFVVEEFFELQAPAAAADTQFGVDADWARRFPSEQAWCLRKTA